MMVNSTAPGPAVTVVVPAYNVAAFIAEALTSIQAQSHADFEAIIVDDGSTDDTADRIAPFLADPRFRLIRSSNGGIACARNQGIAAARAPFIALLDGDDRYRPDYLARMLARITATPAVDFVTCDAQSFTASAGPGEQFSRRYAQGEPITARSLLDGSTAIFGLCLLRTDVLRSVGGYDEAMRAAEDLDLWLRLLGGGRTGGYVPAILVEYRRREGSLSQNQGLLLATRATAFAKAARALEGTPEAALATARYEEALALGQFEAGVDRVLAGDTRIGIAAMRASGVKRAMLKWSLALMLFSLAPPLARPAMAFYRRGNQVGVT